MLHNIVPQIQIIPNLVLLSANFAIVKNINNFDKYSFSLRGIAWVSSNFPFAKLWTRLKQICK